MKNDLPNILIGEEANFNYMGHEFTCSMSQSQTLPVYEMMIVRVRDSLAVGDMTDAERAQWLASAAREYAHKLRKGYV